MPASRPGTYLKQLIPPLFLSLIKKGGKYGWKGDYKSWQEAKDLSDAYDDVIILEKVKQALLKIKNGEAIYERDSVLFDQIHYSWPLLSALLWITTLNKGSLKVVDFGGSLAVLISRTVYSLPAYPDYNGTSLNRKTLWTVGRSLFRTISCNSFSLRSK